MKKSRLFIENFLIYGLGGVIGKAISIVMIPIIASIMPSTEYYGISDTLNIINSLCCSVAVLGMYYAMFRLFFEEESEDYKKKVCSTAFVFTLVLSFVVAMVIVALRTFFAEQFLKSASYSFLLVITACDVFIGATNSIVSAPTRMQNKRKVFLFTNAFFPLLGYLIALFLLLKGYYIIALPVSTLVSGLATELLFFLLNKKWFSIRKADLKTLKELICIAIPIAPNILIYWIYNSCDRIMITNYLGIGQEGIYGIGAKLGQISQLIYLAFAGGWQYFAFSTMKDKNRVVANSKVFEYLAVISFFSTICISAISSCIFRLLFDSRYYTGYIVSPYLFFGPLIQMLFQTAASQFTIVKKTYFNLLCLLVGVLVNIVLNICLIQTVGIEGAAIATVLGYMSATLLCVVLLQKFGLLVISKRLVCTTVIFVCLFVLWRFWGRDSLVIGIFLVVVVSLLYLIMYKNELLLLLQKVNTWKKNK